MDREETGAGQLYAAVVGVVPEDFGTETVTAWRREEARGWVTGTRAHGILRAVDGSRPGNSIRKQMAVIPEARIPVLADCSQSITEMRHADEVGYVERFKAVRAEFTQETLPAAPSTCYPIGSPPYLNRSGYQVTQASLVFSRYHRDKSPFLVGWHQQEFPSCSAAIRGLHYVRAPHWF